MASTAISKSKTLSLNSTQILYEPTGVTHAIVDVMASLVGTQSDTTVDIGIRIGNSDKWAVRNIILNDIEPVKSVDKIVLRAGQVLVARRTSGNDTVSMLVSGIEEQNMAISSPNTGLIADGTAAVDTLVNCLQTPSTGIAYSNTMLTVYNTGTVSSLVRVFVSSTSNPPDTEASVLLRIDVGDTAVITNLILHPGNYILVKSHDTIVDYHVLAATINS